MLLSIIRDVLGVGVCRFLGHAKGVNLCAKLLEKSLLMLPMVSSSAAPVVLGDVGDAKPWIDSIIKYFWFSEGDDIILAVIVLWWIIAKRLHSAAEKMDFCLCANSIFLR